MSLRYLIDLAFSRQVTTMVDSAVDTTREFWRTKYYAATPDEARDPRPFAEVLAERPQETA